MLNVCARPLLFLFAFAVLTLGYGCSSGPEGAELNGVWKITDIQSDSLADDEKKEIIELFGAIETHIDIEKGSYSAVMEDKTVQEAKIKILSHSGKAYAVEIDSEQNTFTMLSKNSFLLTQGDSKEGFILTRVQK